ncbi:ligand-gated channel [Cytophagales bacterium WSM2-2]|nr:ligand-gated channel [Cytophagales bacterium WSM2-2]
MKKILLMIIFSSFALHGQSQSRLVTGVVTSSIDGIVVAGANIQVKGTGSGTVTDSEGKFSVSVPNDATFLVISFIGYQTLEIPIPSSSYIAIVLRGNVEELQEVVVSVGRGSQRTFTDTPLPVDNITIKELISTGQPSFDKALQYKVPSFNSVNTPVNDATSLYDPYELRNLGPSRTLILINGKRKNLTSLVYTQPSPGRGETGADLSAIPQDAIKRVEILRDGASAQYGSDAIAGVVNVILKDRFDASTLRLTTGITSRGDGGNYGINYNSGSNIGRKGFINYHIAFLRQQRAVRSGNIDPVAETDPVFGFGDGLDASGNIASTPLNDNILSFLKRFPDGRNINATTDNTSAKFLINMSIPLNEKTEFYANAAYIYRKALSFANYRQPYWKLDYGLLHTVDGAGINYTGDNTTDVNNVPIYNGYVGYIPTFEGDLNDYNATMGLKSTSESGWKQDMSLTVGGNKMLFTVNHTVNHDLNFDSPVSFKPGGFSFRHMVGNIDISKSLSDKIFLGVGTEFRAESWQQIAGDAASYFGEGANSFAGYPEKNAINTSRLNIGGYVDLGFDITDSFFVGVTGRSEKYSDFGNTNIGKINSRLKLIDDKLTLRASVSNGFRAPTLAQYNLSLNQASLSGGNIVIQGLANNYSREAAVLGVPKLRPETSTNITFGLGLNPSSNFSLTLDYYSIDIKDRIVYSALVKTGVSPELDALLAQAKSTGISFFINGAHTQTRGIDLVASLRKLSLGTSTLNLNFAGNYVMKNDLIGSYQVPPLIANAGGTIFTRTEQAVMLTSRPKYKYILGAELLAKKWTFNVNNTYVGPAYFSNVAYADFDQLDNIQTAFDPRLLTDMTIGFDLNSKTSFSMTISNLLDVYPKYKLQALNANGENFLKDPAQARLLMGDLTFNGRYSVMTGDAAHLNQLGRTFLGQMIFKF